MENHVDEIVSQLLDNYRNETLFFKKPGLSVPNRKVIIEFLTKMRRILFPGYFDDVMQDEESAGYFAGHTLIALRQMLCTEIAHAFAYYEEEKTAKEIQKEAQKQCDLFFSRLPYVQQMLMKDVQAAFDGDPAAQSKEDVILSYPGLFAIYVYRLAHELYTQKVPLIPRIMTEYAHSQTGIDINAGAKIGEYFFMDHGTGIVIGETTEIGAHVKLYQGVTLGALSTKLGQQLSGVKRHPTIGDYVTIYSNASVLGGETVIGAHCVIGGSAFITESVPANTKVNANRPELTLKGPGAETDIWE